MDSIAPVDFAVIEDHKENIQSLPGGRSATALATLYTPPLTGGATALDDALNAKRAEFEREIACIDDADDPLDIYDRYIKWTIDTYPSATTNLKSPLPPLLDRARQAFLTSKLFANDPRYLKIWLQYIHLFSDAPREAFVFLARHGVGETLALFYEKFAAWLERQARWTQADEVYKIGIEKGARPAERLLRKFHEFERRKDAVSEDLKRPDSPALPVLRAALATKGDPLMDSSPDHPQQQQQQPRAGSAIQSTKKSSKMAIFSDQAQTEQSALGTQHPSTWNSIESLADRRRENAVEPKPWAGETLKVGKTNAGMEKIAVFKSSTSLPSSHADQCVKNPRTGKTERIVVCLDAVFPLDSHREYCFEELMAQRRGFSARSWALHKAPKPPALAAKSNDRASSPKLLVKKPKIKSGFEIFDDHKATVSTSHAQERHCTSVSVEAMLPHDENDENAQPIQLAGNNDAAAQRSREAAIAKRLRREERANRTRRIQIMDIKQVSQETQTVQLNLNSPKGPTKIRRKKAPEPTMTINTREAMDEIYGIMSQPTEDNATRSDQGKDDSDCDDDDDYTSGAESTTTGKISCTTSEYGEETQREILLSRSQHKDSQGTANDDDTDIDGASTTDAWTDFDVDQAKEALGQHHSKAETHNDVSDSDHESPRSIQDDLETPDHDSDQENQVQQTGHRVGNGFRDGTTATRSRLPFMTPIVEQTESSLGILTTTTKRDYFTSKTPSRQTKETIEELEEADDDDDDETVEVPFGKLSVQEAENKRRVLQPLWAKTTRGTMSLYDQPQQKGLPTPELAVSVKQSRSTKALIAERRCNPHDRSIRSIVLGERVASLQGYHRHAVNIGKIAEIRKYIKTVQKNGKQNGDKPGTLEAPRLEFPETSNVYQVRRELGAGAFAPVYLVERSAAVDDKLDENDCDGHSVARMGEGAFSAVHRGRLEALKVEASETTGDQMTSSWEFYMLKLARERLGVSRAAGSIIQAHEMHVFRDESFLIEEYRGQGTLLNLVNRAHEIGGVGSSVGTGLDETLVMFFAIELLRTIEGLHKHGIIHGDIKGDNVLMRLDLVSDNKGSWDATYSPDGTRGWSEKGISLIDFGRSIDMQAFEPDVQFIADWAIEAHDCIEMRECRPWTYQVDYHGLAGTIHMLLFGKYMETCHVADSRGGGGGSSVAGSTLRNKSYKIREPFKRYWQTELWGRVFGVLLNPARYVDAEEGGRLPVVKTLRAAREDMERWLAANCERGTLGLKAMLRRIEDAVNGPVVAGRGGR